MKKYIASLISWLNKNRDKQLHFLYIIMVTMFIHCIVPFSVLSILASLSIAISIGILKQYIDTTWISGKFSCQDIIAGIMGWLVVIIFNTIFFSINLYHILR